MKTNKIDEMDSIVKFPMGSKHTRAMKIRKENLLQ